MTTGGRRGHDEFVPLAEKIARYGFRVMLHDRRNTGASDILIEGEEGEEVIWTRDMHALLSEAGRAARLFQRLVGRRAHLDAVLSEISASRARAACCCASPAARLRRPIAGTVLRPIHPCRQGGRHGRDLRHGAWQERIAANPANGEYLAQLPARQFIDVLTRWNEIFVAGAHHPVMGVSPEQLRAIKAPTLIIPGNDQTHSSVSGLAAHRLIAGSILHRLPIEDQDVPLIPYPEWGRPSGRSRVRRFVRAILKPADKLHGLRLSAAERVHAALDELLALPSCAR